ncbi:uncharacterized protein LOC118195230 [Stegodyphus dumicola]|uniref:uncharacterized protein LOC118195230 n=1 Tax=Stegodyphus dumicola TaxID=202533 RepID=UPI0015ACD491|nr:uncharacterized protein LOC118195230 [Stegodyphus dumicola]
MSQVKATITLFAFLCFFAAANAAKDNKNQTISCAFGNYSICYSQIASLGADFTAKYAESLKNVTEVCKNAEAAKRCIESVPQKCSTQSLAAANANVTKLITNLCTNKSRSQNSKYIC